MINKTDKEIIKILINSNEGVSVKNVELFKMFSKESETSEEVIEKIAKYCNTEENVTLPYHEYIMCYVRQALGFDAYDTSKDALIQNMNKDQVFEKVLNWHGIIGYGPSIKGYIEDIFGVSLTLTPQKYGSKFFKSHGITSSDIEKEIQYMEMNNKKEVHNNNAFIGYSLNDLKELLSTY